MTARTEPRATAIIDVESTAAARTSATSAVPRADPFITAVPLRTSGTKKVTAVAAAVTRAKDPETQNGQRKPGMVAYRVRPVEADARPAAARLRLPSSAPPPSGPGAEPNL